MVDAAKFYTTIHSQLNTFKFIYFGILQNVE